MSGVAYYNEIDPFAAAWLRNLIAAGHIAPGEVDERDIRDVEPDDLRGFTQCHFFAGIGVWSYALRLAGWPDDRPVWTGSCPCQPFSAAGGRRGITDERHLWPFWFHLVSERRPPVVFGEQVASKDGLGWLDLVQDDLENAGYAFGAVDLSAAGVGAPHIRQRLWFVAHADRKHGDCRRYGSGDDRREQFGTTELRRSEPVLRGMADAEGAGLHEQRGASGCQDVSRGPLHAEQFTDCRRSSFWSDADWIPCRDGKARPVEPGTFPLANGVAGRVGRLRAYGNAIVAPVAAAFVAAALDVLP